MKKNIVIGAAVTASLLAGEAAVAQYNSEFSVELRARVVANCAVVSVEQATIAGIDGLELQTVCNSENFQISLRTFDEALTIGNVSSNNAHVTSLSKQGVINVLLHAPGVQRIFIEIPNAQNIGGFLEIDIVSA